MIVMMAVIVMIVMVTENRPVLVFLLIAAVV